MPGWPGDPLLVDCDDDDGDDDDSDDEDSLVVDWDDDDSEVSVEGVDDDEPEAEVELVVRDCDVVTSSGRLDDDEVTPATVLDEEWLVDWDDEVDCDELLAAPAEDDDDRDDDEVDCDELDRDDDDDDHCN